MWNLRLAAMLVCGSIFCMSAFAAQAEECQSEKRTEPLNLTVPVTFSLPMKAATAPTGTVLYKKEASLAQLTGTHKPVTAACIERFRQSLVGRISLSQSGHNTYATSLPGLGLRITVIYDKPGATHREWALPFNAPVGDVTQKNLTTDDIKLRLEAVKTGAITNGTLAITLPSLVSLSDNSLMVSLALNVISAKAHCAVVMPAPQLELAPIDASELMANRNMTNWPVSVSLQCLNTQKASIRIEGVNVENKPSIFKNLATESPAQGVGIEMLYNGIVMTPGHPVDITMQQQQNGFSLPLAVRYARAGEKITGGKVKSQITLHINYL